MEYRKPSRMSPCKSEMEFYVMLGIPVFWTCLKCGGSITNKTMMNYKGLAVCGGCYKETTKHFVPCVGPDSNIGDMANEYL
jgi:hypothetical protein